MGGGAVTFCMAKFIVSVDNTADYFKSFMDANGIYYLPLKRIMGGNEYIDFFDTAGEFEAFYDEIKKGAKPTTSQINPDEFIKHFNAILAKEKTGDIVHISLSSGLSGSHNSAVMAANEINPTLKGRKIYAFDSLTVSGAIQMQVDKFLALRDTTTAESAIEIVTKIRDNQHLFFLVDDLFHLKRGGRISAGKAIIGSLLGIKPVIIMNLYGKLAIIDRVRGLKKALEYFENILNDYAVEKGHDFAGETLSLFCSTKGEFYEMMRDMILRKYPKAVLKENLLGSVIGSHVGCGAVAISFTGKPRLDKQ